MVGLLALLLWVGAALFGLRLYDRLSERAGYGPVRPVWLNLLAFVVGSLGLLALGVWGMIEFPSHGFDPSGDAASHRDLPSSIPLVSLAMLIVGTALFAFLLWRAGRRRSVEDA